MAALDRSSRLLDIDEQEEPKAAKSNPNQLRNLTYGILIFIVICIVIALSVSLSLLLNKNQQNAASQSSVQVLNDNIEAIEDQLLLSATHTEQFKQDFDKLQVHLRHSSATALKNILIDQERNIQNMLTILNASMRDLAIDIPDGEDWYKNYGAQLSKVQRLSMQREELLRLLQTGEAKLSQN